MKKEYMVEMDGINDYCTNFYKVHSLDDLIVIVKKDLDAMGGGHADIFDNEDNFITDVEV